ncbi:asparagine--tRNA ligase [bacterium]|nr:asparagine--tRNA ligase [bacterium]
MAANQTISSLALVGKGEVATVLGWVQSLRDGGKLAFLTIRDGTGTIQAVLRPDTEGWEERSQLGLETAVLVTGEVRADPRAEGGVELAARGVRIVGASKDYPIQQKEHSVGFLMDHRHLWLRRPSQARVLRLRSTLMLAAQTFLQGEGFHRVDSPILTPNACEGTSTLFSLDYFGRQAHLSQSGQLYNEAAAVALGKVYCFGPTFRAEKSKTRRHLTEFWMLEPEAVGMDLEANMVLQERLVVAILEAVLDRHRADLLALGRDIGALTHVRTPFPRISYTEALEMLAAQGLAGEWGREFTTAEEDALADEIGHPFFLHRFPAKFKAFYLARDDDDRLSLSVDMFMPEGGGEITGGGVREADATALEERLRDAGLDADDFAWYLDLRRYGSVGTSGFGLGVERLVRWITGIAHVRGTIPWPRTMDRLSP